MNQLVVNWGLEQKQDSKPITFLYIIWWKELRGRAKKLSWNKFSRQRLWPRKRRRWRGALLGDFPRRSADRVTRVARCATCYVASRRCISGFDSRTCSVLKFTTLSESCKSYAIVGARNASHVAPRSTSKTFAIFSRDRYSLLLASLLS